MNRPWMAAMCKGLFPSLLYGQQKPCQGLPPALPSSPTPAPPTPHLKVDVGPVVHQELEAQGPVGGDGSKVQGGEALLIGLIDVGAVVDQLVGHGVLAHVTGDVKCSVTEGIWFIDLGQHQETTPKGCGA